MLSSQSDQTMRFRLCKNGQCREATQAFKAITSSDGQDVGPSQLKAICFAKPTPSSLVITCDFVYDIGELVNGDEFFLSVFDQATDAQLSSAHALVTYTDTWPNGEECPPRCRRGSLNPDAE